MSKHTIVVTITAAHKREILAGLQDEIADQVGESLNLPWRDRNLGSLYKKAIKEAASQMYDDFVVKLLKEVANEIDVGNEPLYDTIYDYAPLLKVARRIARNPVILDKAREVAFAANLAEAEAAASLVGKKLVDIDD